MSLREVNELLGKTVTEAGIYPGYTREDWKKDRKAGDAALKRIAAGVNKKYPKTQTRFQKDRAWDYSMPPEWSMRYKGDDDVHMTRISVSYKKGKFNLTIGSSSWGSSSSHTQHGLTEKEVLKKILAANW